jgi:cell division protein FtsW (lipid II flippase)
MTSAARKTEFEPRIGARAAGSPRAPRRRRRRDVAPSSISRSWLAVLALLGIGFLMVTSASMPMADRNYEDPFFFVLRHGFALGLALACGLVCFAVPLEVWQRAARCCCCSASGCCCCCWCPASVAP